MKTIPIQCSKGFGQRVNPHHSFGNQNIHGLNNKKRDITEPIIQEEKPEIDLTAEGDNDWQEEETAKAVASSPTGQTDDNTDEQTKKILSKPSHKSAVEFLRRVQCYFDKDEDIYVTRYFDFIAGFNKCEQQSTREREELVSALKRLIDAAKPHCNSTSTLNMRVKESEETLTKLNLK